jgi:hypothetical protein
VVVSLGAAGVTTRGRSVCVELTWVSAGSLPPWIEIRSSPTVKVGRLHA